MDLEMVFWLFFQMAALDLWAELSFGGYGLRISPWLPVPERMQGESGTVHPELERLQAFNSRQFRLKPGHL